MLAKARLFINTIRYLKISQLWWQVIYKIKRPSFIREDNKFTDKDFQLLQFKKVLCHRDKYLGYNAFKFLNLEKEFKEIDWNFFEYGKLWNYNLEYFDFLLQEDVEISEKIRLINDFYSYSIKNRRILEPYPVSLRVINILKFFSINNIKHSGILRYVHSEVKYLYNNLEYHILGNHLLENGFALLVGGVCFRESSWVDRARRLLIKELDEQIHSDGAHFELSPMYHNIIFFRVLELIDWYSNYKDRDDNFLEFLKSKASIMESFLKNISFKNGDIPHFNDSTNGIAFAVEELYAYFDSLNLKSQRIPLSDSGYRSFSNEAFEVKIDVAQLAVDYQPGHAHADSLSFLIYYKNKPFIVEQGTSTYQINKRRFLERSSHAHNTVTINRMNHSEVWSGFRVGNRAFTKILFESPNFIKAQHDGYYNRFNVIHTRTYKLDSKFEVCDEMSKKGSYECFIHFHSNLTPFIQNNHILFKDSTLRLRFDNADKLCLEVYQLATGYNSYKEAWRAVISFHKSLRTVIEEI